MSQAQINVVMETGFERKDAVKNNLNEEYRFTINNVIQKEKETTRPILNGSGMSMLVEEDIKV